jgi:hypothetical protein
MSSEADRNTEANKSLQNPDPAPPPTPPTDNQVLPRAEEQPPDNRVYVTLNVPDRTKPVEVLQVIVNGALAVIGLFALWIYRGELHTMNGQLTEIQRQYPELQKSAEAAKNAATEAKSANDITREALVSVQRAYVFTGSDEIIPIGDEDGKVISAILPVKLENSGSTPTRKTKAHINWHYYPTALPKGFRFPDMFTKDSVNAPFVIGPRGHFDLDTEPIRLEILEAVRLHRFHLYLWGWAKYYDVFKDTPLRLTEFCYDVSPVQGAMQPSGFKSLTVRYNQCVPHNCYDEECSDYAERAKSPN